MMTFLLQNVRYHRGMTTVVKNNKQNMTLSVYISYVLIIQTILDKFYVLNTLYIEEIGKCSRRYISFVQEKSYRKISYQFVML